tara:strand:- start:262 stop:441 length:180 start_codon:yes stop_codon:yes gene_type:complete
MNEILGYLILVILFGGVVAFGVWLNGFWRAMLALGIVLVVVSLATLASFLIGCDGSCSL